MGTNFKRGFRIFFLMILMPTIAYGSDRIDFGGEMKSLVFIYSDKEKTKYQNYLDVQVLPDIKINLYENTSIVSTLDVRIDNENYSHGYIDDIIETENRRAVNLQELYVDIWGNYYFIKLGKQIFDWSLTDTVSPSDNINPRDWTDFVEFEKTGTPAIDFRIGYSTFFEIVYVPWFTVSKLPGPDNRWFRELPGEIIINSPKSNRGHGQVALRAGTTWNGYDFNATYYNGYSYSPSFRLDVNSPTNITLTPVYQHQEVYALAAAKELFAFNLRGEIGYFDQNYPDDFIQYVIGVDREWSGLFSGTDSLYILIQYMDETVVHDHNNQLSFTSIDFRRILSDSVAWKSQYNFDVDTWGFQINGTYNFKDKDSYIEPSMIYIFQNIRTEIGYGLFSGPGDAFWGGYRNNNRFFIRTNWWF